MVVPTTGMAEMILKHETCDTCWSMLGATWKPDWDTPIGGAEVLFTKKKFEYISMYHVKDVETKGHYWRMNACLDSAVPDEACATDLIVYAVHEAKPSFHSLNAGFFGLSPSKGIGQSSEMNLI